MYGTCCVFLRGFGYLVDLLKIRNLRYHGFDYIGLPVWDVFQTMGPSLVIHPQFRMYS